MGTGGQEGIIVEVLGRPCSTFLHLCEDSAREMNQFLLRTVVVATEPQCESVGSAGRGDMSVRRLSHTDALQATLANGQRYLSGSMDINVTATRAVVSKNPKQYNRMHCKRVQRTHLLVKEPRW